MLRWSEREVWDALKKHGIDPHPAYKAGFGRLSCRNCIFASADQWATLARHDPQGFDVIAAYEERFGCTIHRTQSVTQRARAGTPYPDAGIWMSIAMSRRYDGPILVAPETWTLPAGAFSGHGGPS